MRAGDFAQLRQLKRKFEILHGADTRARLAKVVGAAALKQLQDGFRKSQDPYGVPWRPLARNRKRNRRKGGSSKPLLDTGRLRRSFALNPAADGFTIWTKTNYAAYHQFGTRGRSSDQTRFQPISSRGRFITHAKAGRAKRVVHARALSFAKGGGKIPQRMMVPSKAQGLGLWQGPMQVAAHRFMLKIFQRVI